MTIDEKIDYWLDIAQYDLKSAKSMQESNRYLYTVFLCQQATEKILKAVYIKKCACESPRTHSLVHIQSLLQLDLSEEYLQLLAELTAYYIEGRYPTYKKKLSALISKNKASQILKKTEELFKCLKSAIK
jgi:HEPN domain-containing protein